ncbi:MAG TPA: ribosome biogenesis factor YjgA [Steroidobacteraceae bacterium]|nr:ribosome biogenesis factor YjgA [Steroidobacteraceae bacterium]
MAVHEETDEAADKPSKSERKRAAHALQDLGEALISLKDADLVALELPEALTEAIRDARRITSRGGGARQRQYIGKLMRDVDPQPIQAALAERGKQAARDAERFRRLEDWRDRLLREGVAALDELERWRPGLDRNAWLARIGAAQAERARSGAGAASRELFRALRDLFAGEP